MVMKHVNGVDAEGALLLVFNPAWAIWLFADLTRALAAKQKTGKFRAKIKRG